MPEQYFRVIQTSNPEEKDARLVHEQQLNNYLRYGQPWIPRDVPPNAILLPYEVEVKKMSTATTVKNHSFIITTTLCCEDKYEEVREAI